jgi:GTP cyclohydrolase III
MADVTAHASYVEAVKAKHPLFVSLAVRAKQPSDAGKEAHDSCRQLGSIAFDILSDPRFARPGAQAELAARLLSLGDV